MNKKLRVGLECASLLVLTGVLAAIRFSNARPTPPELTAPKDWGTTYQNYAGQSNVTVGATVRNFAGSSGISTHPDFRLTNASGPGRYADIMAPLLGSDGKPVFESTGHRVVTPARDAAGNPISPPESYIESRPGDTPGSYEDAAGGAVSSASTLSQWYRDVAGVNTTSASHLTFQRQGEGYVFDGSLDRLTGTPLTSYTTEMEYYFVYEQARDYYFTAQTNAEIWVFIDGRLVIDGGGLRGVEFRIDGGRVIPAEPFDASVTVIGAAIQSGSTPVPVTLKVQAGSTSYEPFGAFLNPTAGNVNDNHNPRFATIGSNLPAGTAISITGRSWLPSGGSYSAYRTIDSATNSPFVRVLRDGDTAPDIRPFQNQTTVRGFLAPYIDPDTQRVILQANQAIFLFELGTSDLTNPAADFQDLVTLVTLSRVSDGSGSGGGSSGGSGSTAGFEQRIDLSRLGWLEDRGAHKMKILFANRTGSPSSLRLQTNILTLNLANRPRVTGVD
ncbi:MAG: hypothetical protein AB7G11_03390 [Phycisphaerales bacterium]